MESPPVLLYRFGHLIHRCGLEKTALLISWINRFLFATWIPSSCFIGKNLSVGYWGLGVVIHSRTKIGNDCTIAQNVTIARKDGVFEVPEIGDDVYIGAGACILGPVKVGNGSIIGANSFVNKKVEPYSIIAGVPAKKIGESPNRFSTNNQTTDDNSTGTGRGL